MKNYLLSFLFLFTSLFTYGQVNYCDSIEIQITNQSLTSITCTTSTNGLNTFWTSQDWILTDKYGSIIGTVSGGTASFSMPNPMNSDTNYICLTSILSNPVLTIACNTCDTIVWDGTNWILLSTIQSCTLNGASVFIDQNTSPPMMNASVNGMSMYDVFWSNGSIGNQTQYYNSWCVTILDIISGCDTTICENCIPDTTAVCACPMIYMPVCGCDGNQYVNYCVAECAGVGWTPAISNGMPGGFLPCTQPNSCIDSSLINPQIMCAMVFDPVCGCDSVTYNNDCEALNWYGVTSWTQGACGTNPCTVNINNGTVDIEICDGDTAILEANIGFDSYLWTTNDTSRIIEVSSAGIYTVIAMIPSANCVSIDSIEIIVYPSMPLNPMTAPNPPMICLGDSIVIEVSPGFINYWWNTGNTLDQGEDRVVVFPTQDFTYVVEALDANDCVSREEIQVYVDTCATNTQMNILNRVEIYPNPSNKDMFIKLPNKQIANISLYDIEGRLIFKKINQSSTIRISKDNLKEGIYIIKIENELGCINKKIIFN